MIYHNVELEKYGNAGDLIVRLANGNIPHTYCNSGVFVLSVLQWCIFFKSYDYNIVMHTHQMIEFQGLF